MRRSIRWNGNIVTVILVLMAGCTEDSSDPTGSSGSSVTALFYTGLYAGTGYWDATLGDYVTGDCIEVWGWSLGSPMPTVQRILLNANQMGEFEQESSEEGDWFQALAKDVPLTGSQTVAVVSNQGTATGTVSVPGPVAITSPLSGSALPSGNFVVTWTGDAEMYSVYVSSESIDDYKGFDTLVTGKSLTVSSSRLVDNYHAVDIGVFGFNGTPSNASETANMTGDALGYLVAFSEDAEAYVSLGLTPFKQRADHPTHERCRQILRRIAAHAGG